VGPFQGHGLLGTDQLGRPLLQQLIRATSTALRTSGEAVALGIVLGALPGLLAGYAGGRLDALISWIVDTLMSFPVLVMAVCIIGFLGPGEGNAVLVIGIFISPAFARIARASVLSVKEEVFIEASRSIGTPQLMIIRQRILPNVIGPLLVQGSFAAASAILIEAGLSFLGLGAQPPNTSWGLMLADGFRLIARQPWLMVWPGVAISLTILAFNTLGDGMRDAIGRQIRTGPM
jgi:ABC-type dipeptide/oligopeptide/nickel transport system permease subunit